MATADLHTHTSRSDGVLEPAELVREARGAGIGVLGLTDHDSVAGVVEAQLEGTASGVRVIPGVELSVRGLDPGSAAPVDDHLLGLFVDPAAPALLAYLDRLQRGRQEMADATIALLSRLGVPVDRERVAELAAGAVVTRPHIARAMVEAGHVASEREAFDRYLGSGRPAALERPTPDHAAAISVVRSAGGVAVLAHPVFGQEPDWAARLERLRPRLDDLAAKGLSGVECAYPDATPTIADRLLAWTRERRLVATGGSDYHGPGSSGGGKRLGDGGVPDTVLDPLLDAERG